MTEPPASEEDRAGQGDHRRNRQGGARNARERRQDRDLTAERRSAPAIRSHKA